MFIPEGWAQANFRFSGSVVPTGAECTMGMNVEVFPGTAADAAAACVTAWEDNILPQQSTSIALDSVLVKFGPASTGESGEAPSGSAGAVGGDTENPNVAVLVNKNTGVGGRQGRGRMFIPGFNEQLFDNGGVAAPADVAALQVAVSAFQVDMEAAGLPLALLHSEDSPISAPYLITSLTVQARSATQRRRLRR